jgi:phosphopantetheinyl transferase
MPFYLYLEPSSSIKIAIWQNTNTNEQALFGLKNRLSKADLLRFSRIQHPTKQLEFLSARAALSEIVLDIRHLDFTEKGKPLLKDKFLSLSHNHAYGAAIVSTKGEVGIDVESLDRKVSHLRHKFISPSEEVVARRFGELFIWVAKEAAYKAYGRKELDFKKHLKVSFDENQMVHISVNIENFYWKTPLYHIRGDESLMCWCEADERFHV